MKKKVLLTAASALLAVGVLAACGDAEVDEQEVEETPVEDVQEVEEAPADEAEEVEEPAEEEAPADEAEEVEEPAEEEEAEEEQTN
ncbi:hypothetical protein ACJ2A9_21000 [Anaerobacillus sp. MEB173]|uniref:hypothetical protein n=1 Tax=Anaerobacillus sp. MEB173 TaxID=3383345 RepID=UPI003F8F0B8E